MLDRPKPGPSPFRKTFERMKSNGRFQRNRGNVGRLRPNNISALGKVTIRVAIVATPGTITSRPSSSSRSPKDRLRAIARTGLTDAGDAAKQRAQVALKFVLISSIQKSWSLHKVSQLMRIFVALGEIKPLVELATDELFHEMGMMPEITGFLEQAAAAEATAPDQGFWAFDGLVFGQLKADRDSNVAARLDAMCACR
jgi:hypothetical protein